MMLGTINNWYKVNKQLIWSGKCYLSKKNSVKLQHVLICQKSIQFYNFTIFLKYKKKKKWILPCVNRCWLRWISDHSLTFSSLIKLVFSPGIAGFQCYKKYIKKRFIIILKILLFNPIFILTSFFSLIGFRKNANV